jgi:hypothetical protein
LLRGIASDEPILHWVDCDLAGEENDTVSGRLNGMTIRPDSFGGIGALHRSALGWNGRDD